MNRYRRNTPAECSFSVAPKIDFVGFVFASQRPVPVLSDEQRNKATSCFQDILTDGGGDGLLHSRLDGDAKQSKERVRGLDEDSFDSDDDIFDLAPNTKIAVTPSKVALISEDAGNVELTEVSKNTNSGQVEDDAEIADIDEIVGAVDLSVASTSKINDFLTNLSPIKQAQMSAEPKGTKRKSTGFENKFARHLNFEDIEYENSSTNQLSHSGKKRKSFEVIGCLDTTVLSDILNVTGYSQNSEGETFLEETELFEEDVFSSQDDCSQPRKEQEDQITGLNHNDSNDFDSEGDTIVGAINGNSTFGPGIVLEAERPKVVRAEKLKKQKQCKVASSQASQKLFDSEGDTVLANVDANSIYFHGQNTLSGSQDGDDHLLNNDEDTFLDEMNFDDIMNNI